MRGFYGITKDSAEHVRFVFVIRVSMFLQNFLKVSLFSGLNNLRDISLDSHYATICGCTDNNVVHVFGPELVGLDLEEIRRSTTGITRGEERVHNSDDVLLLFDSHKFRPYRLETVSPAFLFQTGYLTIAE